MALGDVMFNFVFLVVILDDENKDIATEELFLIICRVGHAWYIVIIICFTDCSWWQI